MPSDLWAEQRKRLETLARAVRVPITMDYHPTGPCGAKCYRDQILDGNLEPIACRPNPAFLGPGRAARNYEMDAAKLLVEATNALPGLLARIDRLEAALQPFAEYVKDIDNQTWEPMSPPDHAPVGHLLGIDKPYLRPTLGHCRAARQALEATHAR